MSTTLIDMELRVGYRHHGKREVKVVPVHLEVPETYHGPGEAEVTFHTSLGDVTTIPVELPRNGKVHENGDPYRALEHIEKQLRESPR